MNYYPDLRINVEERTTLIVALDNYAKRCRDHAKNSAQDHSVNYWNSLADQAESMANRARQAGLVKR